MSILSSLIEIDAQVVGIDDVAANNKIGVSNGTPGW